MKEGIVGYITAMINNHVRMINRMTNPENAKRHQDCIDELQDLLDFVIDIPEGDNPPDEQGEPGPDNVTVNMVNPEDLPEEVKMAIAKVKKAIEALVKQKL